MRCTSSAACGPGFLNGSTASGTLTIATSSTAPSACRPVRSPGPSSTPMMSSTVSASWPSRPPSSRVAAPGCGRQCGSGEARQQIGHDDELRAAVHDSRRVVALTAARAGARGRTRGRSRSEQKRSNSTTSIIVGARRLVVVVDRGRRAPADDAVLDLVHHHEVLDGRLLAGATGLAADAHQRAALEAARGVEACLTRADVEVERQQRRRGDVDVDARPDAVAPATLVERLDPQRGLAPAIDDGPSGALRVIRRGLHAVFRLVRDAHHVTAVPAVVEEALHRVLEVALRQQAIDVAELTHRADRDGLVERTLLGQPDEPRHARVGDVEDAANAAPRQRGRPRVASTRETHAWRLCPSLPVPRLRAQPRLRASLISLLMRAISRSQMCRSSCSIASTSSSDQ